jgi:4-hydroxythreonine-4-phosphate dehydrogenase
MQRPPRIAITVGDPRGIGPEVVAKVLESPPPDAAYLVIGPESVLNTVRGDVSRVPVGTSDDATRAPASALSPKQAGLLTALAVEKAAALALAGEVDAIVTGPAEKRALHLVGRQYPGHTEWLAELAGNVEVAMMLATGELRVVLLTTHIPLRAVPDAITVDRILTVGQLTRRALEADWGIDSPRLALCALNPHAGEGGAFGSEDDTILMPAAEQLGAVGPLPADTVFVRARQGEFDAVLVPSHDVGMTAVKVAGFGTGVNVTLGLPFVRTAPDHGTAFDIAGRGVADPGSMREAVRLAVRLARKLERNG